MHPLINAADSITKAWYHADFDALPVDHLRPENTGGKEEQTAMSKNSRLVYSTETGRIKPQEPTSTPRPSGDGIVRLHRETKGRGGKAVTLITGVPLEDDALKSLAKTLKQLCGVGGALKDGVITIQGDQRDKLKPELEKRGFIVKIAGG